MFKKIEELLPYILRDLSNGIAVSTVDIQKRYGLSGSSVRAHLRSLKENFLKKDITYDASVKKWTAVQRGFLDKKLIKPQEIIVLNSMLRGKNRLGKSLSSAVEMMVSNYIKKTSLYIFEQKNSEEIDENMEEKSALILTAIDEKMKLNFKFNGSKRVVFPYKIVNIEYYWYLLGYEQSKNEEETNSQKIKFFALYKIDDLEVSKDTFEYDFANLEEKIKHIMNAYFSPQNPIVTVYLLVNIDIVEYIERAKFFDLWQKMDYRTKINNKRYVRYEVGVSDESFRDIIPTILKYMPNILVEEPSKLKEEVIKKLNEYKDSYI